VNSTIILTGKDLKAFVFDELKYLLSSFHVYLFNNFQFAHKKILIYAVHFDYFFSIFSR